MDTANPAIFGVRPGLAFAAVGGRTLGAHRDLVRALIAHFEHLSPA